MFVEQPALWQAREVDWLLAPINWRKSIGSAPNWRQSMSSWRQSIGVKRLSLSMWPPDTDFCLLCHECVPSVRAVPGQILCWDLVFHPEVYAERREASSRRRGESLLLQWWSVVAFCEESIRRSARSRAKAEEADKAACLAALAVKPP